MATADETARTPERAAETANLVRAARAGDREAFGRLVELHQRAVTRLAYRILGERDDADGAAQDAFVKAWRSLRRFREECPFDAWLSRIVVNQCRDRLKRARRRVMETPLDLDVAAPSREVANQLDQAVDFAADPEARCAGREIARKIAEQVGTLPYMQRADAIARNIDPLRTESAPGPFDAAFYCRQSAVIHARLGAREGSPRSLRSLFLAPLPRVAWAAAAVAAVLAVAVGLSGPMLVG